MSKVSTILRYFLEESRRFLLRSDSAWLLQLFKWLRFHKGGLHAQRHDSPLLISSIVAHCYSDTIRGLEFLRPLKITALLSINAKSITTLKQNHHHYQNPTIHLCLLSRSHLSDVESFRHWSQNRK